MDDENPPRKIQAARAVACCLWAPIIPLKDAEADGQDANKPILHDAPAGNAALSLADPEDNPTIPPISGQNQASSRGSCQPQWQRGY